VRRRQGGIIWHTQGSGKSIVMVLLARWILETFPDARVVVITDRDELDSQIEGVFSQAGESICRTNSGRDLTAQLGRGKPRLLCSLMHKFGRRDVDDVDAFIKELEGQPSQTVGEVFVFVDECHRTQSGKLHWGMKALMPNAVFIGFTGTPLLKKDKATSLEVFGGYIHTYKFSEADDPRRISPFENLGLLDLIVKSGIAEAVAKRLGRMQANKNAIAETIENNVRRTIIKEHLTDPAFYATISEQLQVIIAQLKAKAIAYEEYLQKIADLAKLVAAGQAKDTPAVAEVIGTWESILGVRVQRVFVQRMKTRWGSCNPDARTIRLNTELAKKPRQCLEYIVGHELMHLLERHHNARFVELMDRHLPQWRQSRDLLNGLPLAHEEWGY